MTDHPVKPGRCARNRQTLPSADGFDDGTVVDTFAVRNFLEKHITLEPIKDHSDCMKVADDFL